MNTDLLSELTAGTVEIWQNYGTMAAELGPNAKLAKMRFISTDIGKFQRFEDETPHAIGRYEAKAESYGECPEVCNAIELTNDDTSIHHRLCM
jgi:ribonuclease Y